jgi:hypothetical protein
MKRKLILFTVFQQYRNISKYHFYYYYYLKIIILSKNNIYFPAVFNFADISVKLFFSTVALCFDFVSSLETDLNINIDISNTYYLIFNLIFFYNLPFSFYRFSFNGHGSEF